MLHILLLFWAIPFAPLIQIPRYGVYEDTIMLTAGICSLVMLVRNWTVSSFLQVSDSGKACHKPEPAEGSGINPS
jgi:hypothetical protein